MGIVCNQELTKFGLTFPISFVVLRMKGEEEDNEPIIRSCSRLSQVLNMTERFSQPRARLHCGGVALARVVRRRACNREEAETQD